MSKDIDKFIVYNIRETYHELGEYEFKVVLNPDVFKNSHTSELSLVDSDGKQIMNTVKKWGRKMNCSFVIDGDVADGVASVKMLLRDEAGSESRCGFIFWVLKP